MPGSRFVPFTGNIYYDGAMCITIFFIGAWLAFVHKQGWGGAIAALMAYWGYLLFLKF